ncbi:hypothetical protein ACHAW6_004737 [Cyclotella cf. meneghiniana]
MTRPDILYAIHQVAKYSPDPRRGHAEAIFYIIEYLKEIARCFKRLPMLREKKEFTATDPSMAKSRNGWIVFLTACPIIWASKLQSQVMLSMTKAKYIAMYVALCEVIPFIELIKEMRENKFDNGNTQP